MRTTHASALAVLLIMPLLAGCASKDAGHREPAADMARTLPAGIRLDGASVIGEDGTSIQFTWTGRVDGEAAVALSLPGTHPLSIEATLAGGASVAIVDEYGRQRCVGDDETPCKVHEVAQLGWTRPWTVLLSSGDAAVSVDLALQVGLAEGRIIDPIQPAGLARIEPFEAVADDGAVLRGHVYVPNGDGPVATLLEFTPYVDSGVGDASGGQDIAIGDRRTIRWASHGPLGVLLDAGFAVALVSLRGTGDSDGCQTWFDLQRDGSDAAAVIGALAAASWSNGAVGMVGISWHGYSQYAALSAAPPALKAVAPSSAILDHWTLWTRNGAPYNVMAGYSPHGTPAATAVGFHALFTLDNGGYLGPAQNVGADGYVDQFQDPPGTGHLACPEYAQQSMAWAELGRTGDDSAFFQARSAADALAKSAVPVFATNGLRPHPWEGHITHVDGLWPLLPEGSVLMVGQWSHAFPSQGTADRYERMLVDWFDQHLRGGPAHVRPGVLYQDMDQGWHQAPRWPPASAPVDLWLSGGALVHDPAEVESSPKTFVTRDGAVPTPDDCPSQATFATPPLAEDVLVGGNFHVELTLSATAPDGNLGVYLWAVDSDYDFDCEPIDGRFAQRVSHGVTDLRHRGDLRTGVPFPLDSSAVVSMDSQAFVARVAAGQRLVLSVGGDAGTEVVDNLFLPAVTVHSDGLSRLTLPVVAGELRFDA